MALRGCLRLAGIEDVGCLSRFHVLTCAVKADWNSGCRLNELMTRFGMCSLSLLGAGRAWLSISAGGEQLSLFSWLSMFFFRLGCRGGCTSLCMVDRYVFLHDWLAFPLHGCAVSAWLLRSARSSCCILADFSWLEGLFSFGSSPCLGLAG